MALKYATITINGKLTIKTVEDGSFNVQLPPGTFVCTK